MEEKKENKTWKIVSIVLNCVFYLFIFILLIFSISNLGMKTELDIPSIFGRGYLTVQTASMEGEEKDSFTTKDLIFVKVITDKNRDKIVSKLEVGDIVTFAYYSDEIGRTILNTHRIVDFTVGSDGKEYIRTQGDKYAMSPAYKYNPDDLSNSKYETVAIESIKAVYTGKWSGFGSTMKFLQTSNGFLICIVLPTALFFIFEAIMLVMNFMKIKNHKSEELRTKEHEEEIARMKAELENEKEKMRAELLKELQNEQNEEIKKEE